MHLITFYKNTSPMTTSGKLELACAHGFLAAAGQICEHLTTGSAEHRARHMLLSDDKFRHTDSAMVGSLHSLATVCEHFQVAVANRHD